MLYTHDAGIDQSLSVVRIGYTPTSIRAEYEFNRWGGPWAVIPLTDYRGTPITGTVANGRRLPCELPSSTCALVEWPTGYRAYHSEREAAPQQSWFGSLVRNSSDGSGLMYRRNRYYNPATGLFTQPDPIGLAGGLNTYGFADGDPVSYSDPYGLAACPNAPEGDPRRTNLSWSDCTAEERRSALGAADEPLIFDPSNLLPAGAFARGWKLLRGFGGGITGRFATQAATRATAEVGELTITHGRTLSRRALDALTDDIAENGIREPIKYVEVNGHKFVVDGHHRLLAARRLKMQEVPVERVQLPYKDYRSVGDLEFHR